MKRIKRHKIKTEKPESSRDHEEHDLAYYIHDRVELMHQVFSILKYKELKLMAPECVRNLAIGDLQELCTEELLGISSKRLLATLDGADPPSDTESSSASRSPEKMETISLDSISSDEEILSQSSRKKKHKHHRNSKSKSKKREKQKQDDEVNEETTEKSKASRAGLTVLELLELQARARAIRAQLQNEQVMKQSEPTAVERSSTDDEVEIKEEAPDVVEISSGDEKPDVNALQLALQKSKEPKPKDPSKSKESSQQNDPPKPKEPQTTKEPETVKKSPEKTTVTKRISDLIITVPQAKATRKIKLKRNKVTVTIPNIEENKEDNPVASVTQTPEETTVDKTKKKKKRKKKNLEKDGSDHDEITLQLSDSEKMDLLEDLNEKNYDKLSSSSSDSEASSSDTTADVSTNNLQDQTDVSERKASDKDDDDDNVVGDKVQSLAEQNKPTDKSKSQEEITDSIETSEDREENINKEVTEKTSDVIEEIKNASSDNVVTNIDQSRNLTENCDEEKQVSDLESLATNDDTQKSTDINAEAEAEEAIVTNAKIVTEENTERKDVKAEEISTIETTHGQIETDAVVQVGESNVNTAELAQPKDVETEPDKKDFISVTKIDDILISEETPNKELDASVDENKNEGKKEREVSEGELSDRQSSEVEAVDVQPEVVCISDDEQQKTKKKKKKEKKAKKEKKSKKSKQDFREGADQNFYKEADNLPVIPDNSTEDPIDKTDDVYEILELSDDSSCYEVEGTVLSKEPTAEEIEALSAKIDEINKEDLLTEQQDTQVETNPDVTKSDSEQETEYISWKDRYLESNKVKKVLTTSNILNALRKKNKELKKKMEEAKKEEQTEEVEKVLEEGTIEHYQTLQSSKHNTETKTTDTELNTVKIDNVDEKAVTREMKKDAKQLLKMYRKLLNCKKIKRREKKKIRKERKKLSNVVPDGSLV